jgi:hydrogenase 3 maturation protease
MKRILLGVGNRLSRDDGVGPLVAQMVESDVDWHTIDCGTAVENAVGIITRERPELLVVVDAARMGLPPGSVRRVSVLSSDRMLGSTHGLPLSFVVERLEATVGDVVLVGVEPADLSFGEGLSPEVENAARELSEVLRQGRLDRLSRLERWRGDDPAESL